MMTPATTAHLYEITQARDILEEWFEESEGEVTPQLEELLAALDGQAEQKIERVALFIRECLASATAVKVERDRLDGIVKREERAAESLKGYLHRHMQLLNKTKVAGLLATVAIQRNSQPSVSLSQEAEALYADDLARPFVKREELVVYSVDRAAILTAWRNHAPLPPTITVELGSHIRVR